MTLQTPSSRNKNFKVYFGSTLLFLGMTLSLFVFGPLVLLAIVLPFRIRYRIAGFWVKWVLWLAKVCCGIDHQVEGIEHIDQNRTSIVLSKHQSAWETLAYRDFLPMQSVLLKQSLLWLPLWGWAMATLKPIAINRKNQRAALRKLLEQGTKNLKSGLWVIIFPEGTRTAPGEVKKFNAGGALLAQQSGCPVVPIAHNAGVYWPRYSFLKYPGTIKVKIGPSIESKGRKAADINAEAEAWIAAAMKEIES
ncbi:MAG: 1-acyl-sn-glycerol-3-phosphate acyltransferase [Methylococcaceae bacterium]|nr:1-acyl-sn-glycerol-3-phosphate acyltransferase [Methylococcaceae bacterium]